MHFYAQLCNEIKELKITLPRLRLSGSYKNCASLTVFIISETIIFKSFQKFTSLLEVRPVSIAYGEQNR